MIVNIIQITKYISHSVEQADFCSMGIESRIRAGRDQNSGEPRMVGAWRHYPPANAYRVTSRLSLKDNGERLGMQSGTAGMAATHPEGFDVA